MPCHSMSIIHLPAACGGVAEHSAPITAPRLSSSEYGHGRDVVAIPSASAHGPFSGRLVMGRENRPTSLLVSRLPPQHSSDHHLHFPAFSLTRPSSEFARTQHLAMVSNCLRMAPPAQFKPMDSHTSMVLSGGKEQVADKQLLTTSTLVLEGLPVGLVLEVK